MIRTPAPGSHVRTHGHPAMLGEFAGVGQQIPEHLLQAFQVGADGRRQAAPLLDFEGQPFLLSQRAEGPFHVVVHVRQRHVSHFDRHRPGFDLGHVEDIVDERQQVHTRRVDAGGKLDLLGGQVGFSILGQELGQNQQAVERGPQLVRHVGQELGFVFRR